MKINGLLPILAALTLSCVPGEEDVKESVQVDGLPETLTFAARDAEAATFTLESNIRWSVSRKDLDWLTVDPPRGSATQGRLTVTLSAADNAGEAVRSGSFTLRAGAYEKTVQVTQAGATVVPSFTVSSLEGDVLSFASDELEPKSFSVIANKDWKATLTGLDWAEVTPLEGRKDRGATVSVLPKTVNEGAPREGSISFAYGADAPVVVRVVQAGFVPTITAAPASLLVAADGTADISTVTVTANGSWTAATEASWITLDHTSGPAGETAVQLRFQVNGKAEDRTAEIIFDNHGGRAVVTVRQVAMPSETLSVDPASLSFPAGGGSAVLNVQSNASWTVTADEDWVRVSPASGSGNATVTVTTGYNRGGDRSARIVVAVSETLKQTVSVTQETGILPGNFIDLAATPVEWISDSQSFNMQRSPAYPSTGQTGARTDDGPTGSGIVFPNREDDLAYAQHVPGDNEYTGTYKTLFIFATEGHITWKPSWTDDAMVFNIPVRSIAAGQTLCFDFAIRGTTACPRYWAAEVNDNGTWQLMDTGFTEDVASGEVAYGTANGKLTGNGAVSSYEGKYVFTAPMEYQTLQIRIRCVYGGIGATGKSYSGIQNNGTLRLPDGDVDGKPFRGPTVYLQ